MDQNEPISEVLNFVTQEKENVLSFITPKNLECCIRDHLADAIESKFLNCYVYVLTDNVFSFYLKNRKVCRVKVTVGETITIKYNTNVYEIKNFKDIPAFTTEFQQYISRLQELYTYIEANYYVITENDLSAIHIYDDLEWDTAGCSLEPNRKRKYMFDCNTTHYHIYENTRLIKSFNSIEELDQFPDLAHYKNRCKLYGCCC